MIRLQKLLAEAGVASRRSSEQIIREGRVTVNGQRVTELGTKVDPARDHVSVDGHAVRPRRKIYLALHKPPGVVCSRKDEKGRAGILELLPPEWSHLYPVGRLDKDSEGLIFLTNDGDFSLHLTHPRYGVAKVYRVLISGKVTPPVVEQMTRGVREMGELLKAQKARLLTSSRKQSTLELVLTEGKNREVRRMCVALNLEVRRLQRIQIGKVRLGELPPGKWRALTESEIKSLLSTL